MFNDYYPQFNSEVLDYVMDFSDWLNKGETITQASGTCVPDSLTASGCWFDDKTVTVRLAGGLGGNTRYRVSVQATTSGGRRKVVEFGILSLFDATNLAALPRVTVQGGIVYSNGSDS